MEQKSSASFIRRLKTTVIGKPRSPDDPSIFHKLSLIAFFAWVGLGADGLSSSCYGPQEAFLALGGHSYLAIFVALGTVITIFVISTSYNQIVELFPTGGGGYIVASKLISPEIGMVAGCALLIDYVLTITLSVASGADAIFSFLPPELYPYKIVLALAGVLALIILNLRGVKESVVPLVPIFLIFIITHAFAIIYTILDHAGEIPSVVNATVAQVHQTSGELGLLAMIFMILRAYSLGAGTFTGIEAVSNGLPILREPKVQTAKRTMRYMATSLSFMVMGFMIGYLLYGVTFQPGKTLNAVMLENMTAGWWGHYGQYFILITLVSEAAILFVASQTGFIGGPAVLANMALDRWFPYRFANLSDRLVTQNGILILGIGALILMVLSGGSVKLLVVLYSINVFITFSLSQFGMVRHWWSVRGKAGNWLRKLSINGIGLSLTIFILTSVVILKFQEGGWITLAVTGSLVGIAIIVKRNYNKTRKLINRLDELVTVAEHSPAEVVPDSTGEENFPKAPDPKAMTAVLLVNGFTGTGLHTLFAVVRLFKGIYKNFIFLQIGEVDAAILRGSEQVAILHVDIKRELDRYIRLMRRRGFYAEGISSISINVVDEVSRIAPEILKRFPQATFFAGQLVFPEDSFLSRLLHNYTAFAAQRKLYQMGIPLVLLPIRV